MCVDLRTCVHMRAYVSVVCVLELDPTSAYVRNQQLCIRV